MKYNFELTEEQADLVVTGLGKLPAEQSMQVILLIQQQFLKQRKGEEEKEEEKEVEKEEEKEVV